jgi:2-succinyl-5-enolpyruvyl-6-hydroxy-3-cyclohexene-1-carboxylate synthase
MIPINRTYAPIQALVDELARCGLRHAVTCPGSRNAPLILTLAGDERIRSMSVLDERSAGYVAIGIAKATGRPVAVACTSGTAAANLLPAVAEAREARVPLVVLTADRPPELRDVGAGQAIDQIKLYGSAVKWFVEVGNHEPGRDTAIHHRALGCRAYFTAACGRPGPVHLNLPLREPLAPAPEELEAADWEGRADGSPWVVLNEAPAPPPSDLTATGKGAIVCGPIAEDVAEPVARLASAAGWPILAEPTSGVRCGPHDRSHVIAHYDALLRSERFAEEHLPELVIRLGDTPTSKPLRAWLARTRQIVIDPHVAWHEPTRMAERIVAAAAGPACEALAEGMSATDADWIESWRRADALLPPALAAAPDPFEPKVYVALAEALPEGATVWLSSSMPVRDVETFFPSIETPVRFLANRGANGIDGVVSSAAGAAAASDAPTYLFTGELALLHDLGGLLAARRHGIELTIVCVNNGGGGIFDFLPVAEHADQTLYEEHVATPAGVNLAEVAALAGLPHALASTPDEVRAAAGSPGLVEVRTDRASSVAWHREAFDRVAVGLEA